MFKKITALLVILCLTFGFTCAVFADGIEYEPNNTMATASEIVSDGEEDCYTYGVVSSSDTSDWFQVSRTDMNRLMTIRLFMDSAINCDLYFYDSTGHLLGSSTNTTLGMYEKIEFVFTKDEVYYIKVTYVSGTVRAPYYLVVGLSL